MRIAICSTEFPPGPGGIGTHAHQLATHLNRLGWEVLVISAQDFASEEEIAAFNAEQPFQVLRFRRLRNHAAFAVSRFLTIVRAARRWKPRVIVATGDGALYLAAAAAGCGGAELAVVEHGRVPRSLEKALKRWALRRSRRVVAVSEYARRRVTEMGAAEWKTCAIHNGADAGFFRTLPRSEVRAIREELGWSGKQVLLTVGNVTRRKGQDVVIRALPRILSRMPDTHYVLAGLPTMRREYEDLAAKLGVAGHVHFTGRITRRRLLEYLNCSDLFVMTSRHASDQFEGFGIAVVEAALCGKPAVVSANSGLLEAIADGETGVAVPEGDERAVAEAVMRLLEDVAMRNRMAEAARARALSGQTWEHCARHYDRLFRDLVQPAAPQSSVPVGVAGEASEG